MSKDVFSGKGGKFQMLYKRVRRGFAINEGGGKGEGRRAKRKGRRRENDVGEKDGRKKEGEGGGRSLWHLKSRNSCRRCLVGLIIKAKDTFCHHCRFFRLKILLLLLLILLILLMKAGRRSVVDRAAGEKIVDSRSTIVSRLSAAGSAYV